MKRNSKNSIIGIAGMGKRKPGFRENSLGRNLVSYTDRSSSSYDGDFHQRLKEMRPDWFEKVGL